MCSEQCSSSVLMSWEKRCSWAIFVTLLAALVILPRVQASTDHQAGTCAMRGICGKRKDGDPLYCPDNGAAQEPSPELATAMQKTCPTLWAQQGGQAGKFCCSADQVTTIASSTQRVVPFVIGCPACYHNFVHFWCILTCSPDQSLFSEVVSASPANDTGKPAVTELNYWVDSHFGEAFFNSCKDVKFGAANVPAMSFIGGGATNYQQWFDFLGLVKDKRFPPIGSPFQINFLPANSTPPGVVALNYTTLVSCGDNAFRCSCSDCPSGPGCQADDDGDDEPPGPEGLLRCHVGHITCWDFALIWIWAAGVTVIVLSFHASLLKRWLGARLARWTRLLRRQGGGVGAVGDGGDGGVSEPLLGASASTQDFVKYQGAMYRYGTSPEINPLQDAAVRYPWVEHNLQGLYYRLGKWCAMNPGRVLGGGVLLLGLLSLGLLRFRVETDPQHLWVGPSSQAAQEKAAFEASFGPFYRVEQLILSTKGNPVGPLKSSSGGLQDVHSGEFAQRAPPILTRTNIELLFAMQALVDNLTAYYTPPHDDGQEVQPQAVALTDVCYKPFGTTCAVQSVLQYWHMDAEAYRKEQDKSPSSPGRQTPEYCLGHWTTECRAAYGAPVDPHVVLGGFPRDKVLFRNYSVDATSFVVTLPLASNAELRPAALAWESAFLALARDTLEPMAAAANLTLSYSAERSVQDELRRESSSDAPTVAFSYLAMLAYIALALGSLPPSRAHILRLFVLSRVGLGLGGVLIVAGSVVGALGVVSAVGLWSTLIIMEVIPFLALAVGVDNMFVLAHALQRQDSSVPLAERVASALSSVGPSITLAASAEVLAFGLGALSPMPAVRNFSVCAAVAIALDFVLQVTVFVSLLALDARRIEQHRVDCAPCLTIRPPTQPLHVRRSYGGYMEGDGEGQAPELQQQLASQLTPPESTLQRLLHSLIHKVHIPTLLHRRVQAIVLAAFFSGLILSLAAIPRLSVGLDQAVALPRDSYLQDYFSDLGSKLRVGPPLFLVVEGLNVSRAAPDINAVCSTSGCNDNSLLNQVAAAARRPLSSFIAAPAGSWIDDFVAWLNPGLIKCCRVHGGSPPSRPSPPPPSPSPTQSPSPPPPAPPDSPASPSLAPPPPATSPPPPSDPGAPASVNPPPPDTPGTEPEPAPSPDGSLLVAVEAKPTGVAAKSEGIHPDAQQVELHASTAGDSEPGRGAANTKRGLTEAVSNIASMVSSGKRSVDAHSVKHTAAAAAGSSQLGGNDNEKEEEGYCPPPDQPPCSSDPAACEDCRVCVDTAFPGGRPDAPDYQHYLPWFLAALPSEACAKGGAGAYSDLIARERVQDPGSSIRGLKEGRVEASAFRTYYTPLNEQHEFISALRSVRRLVSRLGDELGLRVFPYSVFHVFFEQYLHVWRDAAVLLGGPLLGVGLVCWVLTASLWGAALLLVVLTSLLVHLMGAMLIAGIQLNAVSLVNLAMSLGIAVEFCAHVIHAFGVAPGTRPQRMAAALEKSGASVLSGITLTKFVGVAVLAAAKTRIFEVYYFRLYLALVLLGALHGLVLLPILLALAGPPSLSVTAPVPGDNGGTGHPGGVPGQVAGGGVGGGSGYGGLHMLAGGRPVAPPPAVPHLGGNGRR